MRLFAGSDAGAGSAANSPTVVVLVRARSIWPASGSVPVFTDQRSTPHAAHAAVLERAATTPRRAGATAGGTERARTWHLLERGPEWPPAPPAHGKTPGKYGNPDVGKDSNPDGGDNPSLLRRYRPGVGRLSGARAVLVSHQGCGMGDVVLFFVVHAAGMPQLCSVPSAHNDAARLLQRLSRFP